MTLYQIEYHVIKQYSLPIIGPIFFKFDHDSIVVSRILEYEYDNKWFTPTSFKYFGDERTSEYILNIKTKYAISKDSVK